MVEIHDDSDSFEIGPHARCVITGKPPRQETGAGGGCANHQLATALGELRRMGDCEYMKKRQILEVCKSWVRQRDTLSHFATYQSATHSIRPDPLCATVLESSALSLSSLDLTFLAARGRPQRWQEQYPDETGCSFSRCEQPLLARSLYPLYLHRAPRPWVSDPNTNVGR
jgi:hypothetical protein